MNVVDKIGNLDNEWVMLKFRICVHYLRIDFIIFFRTNNTHDHNLNQFANFFRINIGYLQPSFEMQCSDCSHLTF